MADFILTDSLQRGHLGSRMVSEVQAKPTSDQIDLSKQQQADAEADSQKVLQDPKTEEKQERERSRQQHRDLSARHKKQSEGEQNSREKGSSFLGGQLFSGSA